MLKWAVINIFERDKKKKEGLNKGKILAKKNKTKEQQNGNLKNE